MRALLLDFKGIVACVKSYKYYAICTILHLLAAKFGYGVTLLQKISLDRYSTHYQKWPWLVRMAAKLARVKLPKHYVNLFFEEGYHSYKTLDYALDALGRIAPSLKNDVVIVECTLTQGTEYLENRTQYISNYIQINKEVHDTPTTTKENSDPIQ